MRRQQTALQMIQLGQQCTLLAAVAETIVGEQKEQWWGRRNDNAKQQQAIIQHFCCQHIHKIIQANGGMAIAI